MDAHARFDARSQWVNKGKQISVCMLLATKQAISIKLTTTVGHFLHVLDFANVYMMPILFVCCRWTSSNASTFMTPHQWRTSRQLSGVNFSWTMWYTVSFFFRSYHVHNFQGLTLCSKICSLRSLLQLFIDFFVV